MIASATLTSLAQPGEMGFEQPTDLLVGHTSVTQFFDGGDDGRLRGPHLVGELPGRAVGGHERPGAMPQLDDALVFELAVSLGDGVRIDHQLLGDRPDAGQLIARVKRTGLDAVLHLLHQLQVDGNAGGRVGAEQHQLCYSCNTVAQWMSRSIATERFTRLGSSCSVRVQLRFEARSSGSGTVNREPRMPNCEP